MNTSVPDTKEEEEKEESEKTENTEDEIYVYITIFGVTNKNVGYVENVLKEYQPIYLSENYNNEDDSFKSLEWNANNKEDKFDGNFQKSELPFIDKENSARNALLGSLGNWIYAKIPVVSFPELESKAQIKLENNDVVYIMKGKYQEKEGLSELGKKQRQKSKEEPHVSIYKMEKMENLTNLPFEGKNFKLKLYEFILGEYKIEKMKYGVKFDESIIEYVLLTIAILFIIFIYISTRL